MANRVRLSLYRCSSVQTKLVDPALSLIPIIILFTSCHKNKVDHVWFYNQDEVEMLKGAVKELVIGKDSLPIDDYIKVKFNEDGDIQESDEHYVAVEEAEGKRDTVLSNSVSLYTLSRDIIARPRYIMEKYITQDAKGSVDTHTFKWEFNKDGKITSWHPESDTESYELGRYKYDEKGDIIEFHHDPPGKEGIELYKYEYDGHHNLLEKDLYEPGYFEFGSKTPVDKLLVKSTFKYISNDSHGNWTKAVVFSEPFPPMQTQPRTDTLTRKITYY